MCLDITGCSFGEIKSFKSAFAENCPVCGKNPTIKELIDYYDKKFGKGRYEGVLAQNLLKDHSEAVVFNEAHNSYMVNYNLIDVDFKEVGNA